MESKHYISSYCHIKANRISLNGNVLFEEAADDLVPFMKLAYRNFKTDYPKFFKMDRLSKLAFLAAEVLLLDRTPSARGQSQENSSHGNPFQNNPVHVDPSLENSSRKNQNTAIILSNRASSLDTDRKYQESIFDTDNFYPSPAVFVYTLPNICIGEISIRHKLRSENSFFIFDAFNPGFMKDYSESLLQTGKADQILCGWVDVDGDSYEAFLYLVSPTGERLHTEQQLIKLYATP
ncbi:3-oxoacyl-ACP synthase [Pricia mediterranea]|uniref:3-oxoacyl-ACP synthase n=1 Tax=Pricia mediterranea TaxID=3076079 RepID=UPI003D781173